MIWPRAKRYLLPIALGWLGVLLLGRMYLSGAFVLVPEDIDIVLLVSALSITLVAAIHQMVQISMRHLRARSIRQARRQTLAEHRRFLSRLDHVLKNPLTALQVGLKTLSLTDLSEQQGQIVKTLEIETARLSRLVTDLRKLAELETQPLTLQPVNLHDFLDDVIQAERDRFQTRGRSLKAGIDASQPVWTFDHDLLALAIHNLLDNALKYSRQGDTVRVDLSAHQELIVRVSDSGSGIPTDSLPHVWEELYRAGRSEGTMGSGIGLSLVQAIVERHDGTADIESAPEQGTTVTLRLPPMSQSENTVSRNLNATVIIW